MTDREEQARLMSRSRSGSRERADWAFQSTQPGENIASAPREPQPRQRGPLRRSSTGRERVLRHYRTTSRERRYQKPPRPREPRSATFSDPGIEPVPVVSLEEGGNVRRDAVYVEQPRQEHYTDAYESFNFQFPSRSPAADTLRDGDMSGSDVPESEDTSSTAVNGDKENSIARLKQAARIYSSHYEGNAELGATHHISLNEVHDPKGVKEPLFRWLHIYQPLMSYDSFWTDVSHMTHFSEGEKQALARVRAEVKKNFIKTRNSPDGKRVGYMESKFLEKQVPLSKNDEASDDSSTGTVKWFAMPYFVLKEYAGLLVASNPDEFPAVTLLQALYTRTNEQRDMEQAVRQLGIGGKKDCFHIAQLWVLVVQNNCLITCGRIKQEDLDSDLIKITPSLSPDPLSGVDNSLLLVTNGPDVTWAFRCSEYPTWFSFVSQFCVAWWPMHITFKHKDKILKPADWPKVLAMARKSKRRLTLQMVMEPPPEPPNKACMPHELTDDNKKEASDGKVRIFHHPWAETDYLHVFTLRPPNANSSRTKPIKPEISVEALRMQLAAAELFLTEETGYSIQRLYRKARVSTRTDVCKALKELEAEVNKNPTDSVREGFENRIDIFNCAELLFRLFLPFDFEGPTTNKFWGGLHNLLYMPELDPNVDDNYDEGWTTVSPANLISSFRAHLRDLSRSIRAFQSVFAFSGPEDRIKMELPHEFVTAWLHTVTSLILAGSWNWSWRRHAVDVDRLIEAGMERMAQGISNKDIINKVAMLPMEVITLGLTALLQDQVGKSDDILNTYSEYLNSLDTDITTKPSDRSYQHKLDLVQQELTAVKRTLAKQRFIINSLKKTIRMSEEIVTQPVGESRRMAAGESRKPAHFANPDRNVRSGRPHAGMDDNGGHDQRRLDPDRFDGVASMNSDDDQFIDDISTASKLSPTDPGGFRGLFINECTKLVEQREYEFKRYTEYAEDLEKTIEVKMEWTKDRQDNAIYAFTLVTIVFLPLSAVSGVFGMNTSDIRNLEQGQWLYWTVAIPVTLLVIILGLWWMNELDNITGWMFGKQTGRRKPRYTTSAAARSSEPNDMVMSALGFNQFRSEAPPEPQTVRVTEARPVSSMRMEYPISQSRMRRPARPVYR